MTEYDREKSRIEKKHTKGKEASQRLLTQIIWVSSKKNR